MGLMGDGGGLGWHQCSIDTFRSAKMFHPLITDCPAFIPMDYDEEAEAYRTLVAIAECDVTQRAIFVGCELAFINNVELRAVRKSFHEFSFSIVIQSLDGADLPLVTQDRDIARSFIPPKQVQLIMPIVINSCAALIETVRPELIYRVTKMLFPTPPALFKHDLVTDFLYGAGYSLDETGLDPFGRRFWLMKRESN